MCGEEYGRAIYRRGSENEILLYAITGYHYRDGMKESKREEKE
jgi:hypothetical protein